MKSSVLALKSLFKSGDKPSQSDFEDLIDSFVHKDTGVTIRNIAVNDEGHSVFTFSDTTVFTVKQLPEKVPISFITDLQDVLKSKVDRDGNKQLSTEDFTTVLKEKLEQLENYEHPVTHDISEVENLQKSLDGKVNIAGNETIHGQKIFSEVLELLEGVKISNFSGTGLRNLIVQADGTVNTQAIAADVFVNKTNYDEITKVLTLGFVGGASIDVDLSSLEEDLTGLQTAIASLDSSVKSLENKKLDSGRYNGTAEDLDVVKRDKTAFAKTIIDVSGNLELEGDQESPRPNHYYGTNGEGVKGYHAIEPIHFNVTNLFIGGSTNNTEDQELFVDVSSYGVLQPGDQLELNNIEFRGDFSLNSEYVDVAFDNATNIKTRIGETNGIDSSQWQNAESIGDGSVVTIVQLPTEEIGFLLYVSPSDAVNFSPRGMNNWWELRADVQFKI